MHSETGVFGKIESGDLFLSDWSINSSISMSELIRFLSFLWTQWEILTMSFGIIRPKHPVRVNFVIMAGEDYQWVSRSIEMVNFQESKFLLAIQFLPKWNSKNNSLKWIQIKKISLYEGRKNSRNLWMRYERNGIMVNVKTIWWYSWPTVT